jgi:hypothetical protein
VDRIISLNAFGCPLSSRESHFKPQKYEKAQYHSCGIWLKASYINHSCFSNVRRSFIGDLQLVHMTRDSPAGTELTFWYHTPDGKGYEATQKNLENWGFKCDCAICLDSKNTSAKLLRRRETLRGNLKTVLQSSTGVDLAKAERLLTAIEQTYKSPPSKVPRLDLWDPYLFLIRLHAARKDPQKVVPLALKVLDSLGFIINGGHTPAQPNSPFEVTQWGLMVDSVIETWVHLWTAYAIVAPELCEKAEGYAKMAYRMCIGEDVTFDESYGKMAREAIC